MPTGQRTANFKLEEMVCLLQLVSELHAVPNQIAYVLPTVKNSQF
jgi:hypothetical protein